MGGETTDLVFPRWRRDKWDGCRNSRNTFVDESRWCCDVLRCLYAPSVVEDEPRTECPCYAAGNRAHAHMVLTCASHNISPPPSSDRPETKKETEFRGVGFVFRDKWGRGDAGASVGGLG